MFLFRLLNFCYSRGLSA